METSGITEAVEKFAEFETKYPNFTHDELVARALEEFMYKYGDYKSIDSELLNTDTKHKLALMRKEEGVTELEKINSEVALAYKDGGKKQFIAGKFGALKKDKTYRIAELIGIEEGE